MQTKTFLLALSMFVLCAAACARQQLLRTNYVAALAVVNSYNVTYDYFKSEDNTLLFCDDVVQKYAAEAQNCKQDDPCAIEIENAVKNDCEAKVDDFEAEFDSALSLAADAVEVFEVSVDLWDKGKDGWKKISPEQRRTLVQRLVDATLSVINLLKLNGISVPEKLEELLKLSKLIPVN